MLKSFSNLVLTVFLILLGTQCFAQGSGQTLIFDQTYTATNSWGGSFIDISSVPVGDTIKVELTTNAKILSGNVYIATIVYKDGKPFNGFQVGSSGDPEAFSDSASIEFVVVPGLTLWHQIENDSHRNTNFGIRVWQIHKALPNLWVESPKINADGSVTYAYHIGDIPWDTHSYDISVDLYFSNGSGLIGKPINPTPNRPASGPSVTNYRGEFTVNAALLSQPPSGATGLTAVIDSRGLIPESNENDNYASTAYKFNIIPYIPGIMHSLSYLSGEVLLRTWLSEPVRVAQINPTNNKADVSTNLGILPIFYDLKVISMSYILNPAKTEGRRVKDAYNKLRNSDYLQSQNCVAAIKALVAREFTKHPGSMRVQLGHPDLKGASLHEQQVQFSPVDSNYPHVDSITAALHNFSFYAIPMGTATKSKTGTITVRISSVGIYVADIFEFSGNDILGGYLGSWRVKPAKFSYAPLYWNVYNADFIDYRNRYNLGGDFIIMTDVKNSTITRAIKMVY